MPTPLLIAHSDLISKGISALLICFTVLKPRVVKFVFMDGVGVHG